MRVEWENVRDVLVRADDDHAPALAVQPAQVEDVGVGVGAEELLVVDEAEPARLPFQFCEPNGCLAPWAMTEAEIGKLKAGQKLVVIVHDRNGKRFGLPVSLKGFTAALSKLQ